MFTLGFREGLEAALIVMLIAAVLRGSGHQRRLLGAVGLAIALCIAIVVGVRSMHTEVGETTHYTVKAIVAATAVIALTSTARWVWRYGSSPQQPAIDAAQASALVTSAFLAVLREGLELAVFPAATGDDRWAPGGLPMLAGVLLAVAVGALGYRLSRASLERTAVWTALPLVLIAAGLTTSVVRSLYAATGRTAGVFVEVGWLAALPRWLADLTRGLFGWHATPSTGEVVAYGAYAVLAGVLLTRPAPPPVAVAATGMES